MPPESEVFLQYLVSECTSTVLTGEPTATGKTTRGWIYDITLVAVGYSIFSKNCDRCLQVKIGDVAHEFAVMLRRIITGVEASNSWFRLSYFSLKSPH